MANKGQTVLNARRPSSLICSQSTRSRPYALAVRKIDALQIRACRAQCPQAIVANLTATLKVDLLQIWATCTQCSKGLVADALADRKIDALQIRATRAQCPKGSLESLTYWQLTRLMCCKFGQPYAQCLKGPRTYPPTPNGVGTRVRLRRCAAHPPSNHYPSSVKILF